MNQHGVAQSLIDFEFARQTMTLNDTPPPSLTWKKNRTISPPPTIHTHLLVTAMCKISHIKDTVFQIHIINLFWYAIVIAQQLLRIPIWKSWVRILPGAGHFSNSLVFLSNFTSLLLRVFLIGCLKEVKTTLLMMWKERKMFLVHEKIETTWDAIKFFFV